MEQVQQVTYKKVRDLSELFRAVFDFIKLHYKALFGSLLAFSGPFLLVGSLLQGYVLKTIMDAAANTRNVTHLRGDSVIVNLLALVLIVIGITVFIAVLNRNVELGEKTPAGETYTVRDVSRSLLRGYFLLLANMILLTVTLFLSIFIIIAVMGMFVAVLSFFGNASRPYVGIVILLIVVCVVILLMPLFGYIPVAAFFVSQRQGLNIYSSIGRVLTCLRGSFWKSWVIMFVSLITYFVLSSIANLPTLIIIISRMVFRSDEPGEVSEDSGSFGMIISNGVCSILSYGVAAVYYLFCIYQFGSLEEKREGTAIMAKINELS